MTAVTTADGLLQPALAVAVPLWIERLRDQPAERLLDRARRCADEITEHGDLVLYRDRRRGSSAAAFNALAEAVACAALVADGGITLFGLTFTAEEVPDAAAR